MSGECAEEKAIGLPVLRAQVENLYVEAMVLVDEAHAAFAAAREPERGERDERSGANGRALLQVGLACESLKTTTRLMRVIVWLLHRRAMIAGDPGAGPDDSAARIGDPVAADWSLCDRFDMPLRRIVAASERLFARVAALEAGWRAPAAPPPVRAMLAELSARL
jgi:regulator of CtrA degradation